MPETMNLHWCGILTAKNAKQIIKMLLALLTGKKFTIVAPGEAHDLPPRVNTSQTLVGLDAVDAIVNHSRGSVSVRIHSALTWIFKADASRSAIFKFEGNKVTIEDQPRVGPCVRRNYYIFAIEHK